MASLSATFLAAAPHYKPVAAHGGRAAAGPSSGRLAVRSMRSSLSGARLQTKAKAAPRALAAGRVFASAEAKKGELVAGDRGAAYVSACDALGR